MCGAGHELGEDDLVRIAAPGRHPAFRNGFGRADVSPHGLGVHAEGLGDASGTGPGSCARARHPMCRAPAPDVAPPATRGG